MVLEERIQRGLDIVRQGAITQSARSKHLAELEVNLQRLERLSRIAALSPEERAIVSRKHRLLSGKVARTAKENPRAAKLARLPAHRRRAYEEVFSLLYACATDVRATKELVHRVLAKIP